MRSALEIAQCALSEIPGWERAKLSPIQGGQTSDAWLAESGARRAVLKADAKIRSLPFRDRNSEAGIQRVAAHHGLAGKVLYSSATVLLSDYIAGASWGREELAQDDNLEELGQTLSRVHALPLTGVRFDAPAAARFYASRITRDVDRALVQKHVDTVCQTELPAELCCCHNDLVAENMVSTPSLKFLDWEYAADNDPLFDIAIVVAHHDLNNPQTMRLLSAWCESDGRVFLEPLQLQIDMYRSLCWLWRAARS
ncbi:MAG: phosphotransferase [Woeseiaceae bacterium]|nr:phosphotransferase [Woeseiaceae bacterium]